jgi:tetratricopeptide (TPR) repeat protein/Fe-S-cluster containining protein
MNPDAWKAEVTKLATGGRVGEAVCVAREVAVKGNPDGVAAYLVDLGIKVSRTLSLHEAALSLFEAASSMAVSEKGKQYANYNAGVCLTVIGDTFGQQGQLEKAEESLKRAVRYCPGFVLAQKSYGRALFYRGKSSKAEFHLRQALKLDATDAETHVLYGVLLDNMGRGRKALEHFQEAVKLDPENGRFHTFLGTSLMNEGLTVEAEAQFKTAIKLAPDDLFGHYQYGILLERRSRWSEAENQLEKVFQADPAFMNTKTLYSTAILRNQATKPKEQLGEKWKWARKVYFEDERPLDVEDFSLVEEHMKEWKIIPENFSCEQCGKCCTKTLWAGHLDTRLVWEDVQRWRAQNRQDILKYVLAFEGLGGDIIDLKNNKFLSKCPFIKRENAKYACAIHDTKPFVCKITPFYFHYQENCENCKQPIQPNDTYCKNCGIFLKADPNMLLNGCPALKKALKKTSLYKPFRKYDLLTLLRANRRVKASPQKHHQMKPDNNK